VAEVKLSWRAQLAEGRVFELRSNSKRYPAPCALVLTEDDAKWGVKQVTEVDRLGVRGPDYYHRPANPGIYVDGFRGKELTKRIARRRPDLERFDSDDLALIRYGYGLDFTGEIRCSHSGEVHIPAIVPAGWTVFWLAASAPDDYRSLKLWHDRELRRLLTGAWHFNGHGGPRHLGYRFGHAWVTRHAGPRLGEIRQWLRARLPDIVEQHVKVARWSDGQNVYTEEIRRECPALGSRACFVQTPSGTQGIYR